jgi:arabinoxylan arabinofuranohydrolase
MHDLTTPMKHFTTLALAAVSLGLTPAVRAVNPIIQTIHTADPAALVHQDTLYVYTGHDEDKSTWFTMKNWYAYSTKDMVNWTDLGSPLSLQTFAWVKDSAWAGQCIERDGKFYWYVPMEQKTGGMAIGVAVGDSPTGPFKDPLGKPLVFDKQGDIDPAVFIDDDGQAYLSWGNPIYKYVKLNKDMISYDTSVGDKGIFRHPMTVEAFGKREKNDRATSYEEAPWIYKRNGLYYLFFAGGPISEHLAYSTGPGPEGPWKYGGIVMPSQGSSFTNHPAVVDYKGKTYLVYHNGGLPGGGGFTRSVCVDELKFNPDGSVVQMDMTKEGPAPAATLDPYQRVEAETIAWESGIETESSSQGGIAVHDIDDGDFIQVKNVDFGTSGAKSFSASVSCDKSSKASIELHLDSADGPLIGAASITDTAGQWKPATAETNNSTGVHDLFLVFKGESESDLFKIDCWKFSH